MAICIYDVHCDDFSGNGRSVLLPTAASVTERAGGMYELEVTCPVSDDQKYLHLAVGRVLKAPVPARTTPALELNHVTEAVTKKVYRVKDGAWSWRVVRAGPGQYSPILDKLQVGEEVVVTGPAVGGDWRPATSPRGVSGYVAGMYLDFVRDVSEAAGGYTEVIPPKPVKAQLFRIYEVDAAEDGLSVTAKARHISYDLLYNVVLDYKTDAPTKGATACAGIFSHLADASAPWRCFCDVETAAPAADYRNINPLQALLDEGEGVAFKTRSMVLRDNYDFYVTKLENAFRGVTIRHGKNLLGATLTSSDDGVYTRILPYGEDRDGNPLYLEGTKWIDSPAAVNYPMPRIQALKVQGAKVGAKDENGAEMDEAAVRAKLEQEAKNQLGTGVDHTKVKLSVSFVDLGGTEEYARYAALQRVHLYDLVRVVHPGRFIDVTTTVVRYKWNLITGMFDEIELGDPFASQLDTLAGSQIAAGSVTGVQLGSGSVGARQIAPAAITSAQIAEKGIRPENIDVDQLLTSTAMSKAISGGRPAVNLLDNADFRDPVNQRSASGAARPAGYQIDRWFTVDAGASLAFEPGVAMALSGQGLFQLLPEPLPRCVVTLVVKPADGEPDVCFLDAAAPGSVSGACGAIHRTASALYVFLQPGRRYEWAALYEGLYTVDNLPAYTAKGYAAELAACLRYYQEIQLLFHPPGNASTDARYYGVNLLWPMRSTPQIVTLTDGSLTERQHLLVMADQSFASSATGATLSAAGGGPTMVAIAASGSVAGLDNLNLTGTLKVSADLTLT